jgi:Peptidase A4 family
MSAPNLRSGRQLKAIGWSRRLQVGLLSALLFSGAAAMPAAAQPALSHQLLEVVGPPTTDHATQSGNWFGYGQGAAQKGVKLFRAITADWKVPRVTQHKKGQAEYSSDWIGIGGGCVSSGCTVGDNTLIQTGTEQDVSAKGKPSYSAWWELIPAPASTIQKFRVAPGDRMHAVVSESAPGVWRISIRDATKKESFSKTVSYTSTQDTAEWIEETPLLLGTGAGFAPLPNLTSPAFDRATTNGRPAHLARSQEIDLTNSGGKVIGAPSAPDPNRDGFNACTWTRICAAPRTG